MQSVERVQKDRNWCISGKEMKTCSMGKRMVGVWSWTAAAMLITASAHAADTTPEEVMADTPVLDTVLYWGFDYSQTRSGKEGIGIDGGFVTAFNGDIGATGWIFTSSLGFSRTDDVQSNSEAFYGTALIGYQWQTPGYSFSLSAGAHYVDNDEDPPSATDGAELGALAQYGFETKSVDAFYAQSYGALSTAFHQVYFHGKLGYKTPTLRFGPEFTVFDDEGSRPTLRYGAFLGDIPIYESLTMIVSAGYQQELDPGQPNGFYATIGFSVPLSLR